MIVSIVLAREVPHAHMAIDRVALGRKRASKEGP